MKKLILILTAALILGHMQACVEKNEPPVRNIILVIGDGMGLGHVSALMLAQNAENPGATLNIERATVCGLVKTSSADNRVTDSAAAATALATGTKTANGRLSVDTLGNPLETILERARKAGMAVGLVATTFIEHATPAAFYAHNIERADYEDIAVQCARAGLDVANGYSEDLARSTATALETLTAKVAGNGAGMTCGGDAGGFFLMVEGSHIDTRSHEGDAPGMLAEMRDLDRAVGVALDWADTHPGTLVVIVADHETGGLAIPSSNADFRSSESGIEFRWNTWGHTATMVPIFAYGTGAEEFGGVMDNTDVNRRMVRLLGL